jgi:hypothetical protein
MDSSVATQTLRPFGFLLHGIVWLFLTLTLLALAAYMLFGPIWDGPINRGVLENPLSWVFGIPVFTWGFVISPWSMFSQAMLGFVFTGQSLSSAYKDTPLSREVGAPRGKRLEAIVDTPSTRLWTAVGNIGSVPGWRFAASSLVLVIGICLVRFVDSPVADVAGWALVAAGIGVSLWVIVPRLKTPAPLPRSADSDGPEAREKNLKDLA